MFCVMAKDQEFQACVGGELVEDHDRTRIGKYWNAIAAAWFPEGKDDPGFDPVEIHPRRRSGLGVALGSADLCVGDRQGQRHPQGAGRRRPRLTSI